MSSNIEHRGHRLLPHVVDELAKEDPQRILYSITVSGAANSFQDIDAATFARAVNRVARFIENELGEGHGFPTLSYMGPQDLLYGILVLACVKTGYKLLLNSPRNALEAHLALFEKMDCEILLLPPVFPLPVVAQILERRDMRVLRVPVLSHWLSDGDDEVYVYKKLPEDAMDDPFVVLHTSGSTGTPKPVIQTHGTLAAIDAFCDIPKHGIQDTYPTFYAGMRVYNSFPLFHLAGLWTLLPAPLFSGFTVVLGPFPPTVDTTNSIIINGNVQSCALAPMTLINLVKTPEHVENLRRLTLITYGGGPCPKPVGDLIQTKTRFMNITGSTEAGVLPCIMQSPENWEYLSFNPCLGSEFRHISDDLYEHIIVRNDRLKEYQGVFWNFPHLREWPTRDMYSEHPVQKDSWLYRGRMDDIIVFSTGEKLNPITMENMITGHVNVSTALVAGLGKVQASLLLEICDMPDDPSESDRVRQEVLDLIESANRDTPSHGRIYPDMITYVKPEKPLPRAGKGTVQRAMALDLYAPELEALYDHERSNGAEMCADDEQQHGSYETRLQSILAVVTGVDTATTDPDANLFDLGMDSIQVLSIARKLTKALSTTVSHPTIFPRMIYQNPSIRQMTKLVAMLAMGETTEEHTAHPEEAMQATYESLKFDLPISARDAASKTDGNIVLLTGSTGSLGAYILHHLLQDSRISKIWCLNRGPHSEDRQRKSHDDKGLPWQMDKVRFVDANFSLSHFGLSSELYRALLSETTLVIHNAWQVDFNLAFEAYIPQLSTVRQLINFSSLSQFGAHIIFVSSISAVSGVSQSAGNKQKVPEKVYTDWRSCLDAGYGRSKLVAECLLNAASVEADIPTTVVRVGQIAGPSTKSGIWPKQEWVPSLIESARHLKSIPDSLGRMSTLDWVSVDDLGQILVEISLSTVRGGELHGDQTCNGAQVYHCVNPQTTEWRELVRFVADCLESSIDSKMEVVPFKVWVKSLEEAENQGESTSNLPALKLLDFYQSLAEDTNLLEGFDTKRSAQGSKTLSGLKSVSPDQMKNWINQWGY